MKSIQKTMCAFLIFGSCLNPAFSESCENFCISKKTTISTADSSNIEKQGLRSDIIKIVAGVIIDRVVDKIIDRVDTEDRIEKIADKIVHVVEEALTPEKLY